MFSKRTFWRKNKPKQNNWLEASDQGKDTPFVAPIQTKLNIGKPGDVYEKEADATADEVVGKTGNQPQIQKMGEEQEEVQTKSIAGTLTPFVQKQEEKKEDIQSKEEEEVQMQEEEEAVQSKGEKEEEVQMQEEEESVQKQEKEEAVQTKCDDCAEEEKSIQKQEEEEAVQSKEDKEDIQTKSDGQTTNSRSVESKLSAHRGGGHVMDSSTQSTMEQAFSNDFSNVKIHTGNYAQEMNRDLRARAFTNGNDIYFNSGEYNPKSKEGKHLLAHELTHTIQQKGATDKVNKQGQPNAQHQCVPGSVLTQANSTLYFNQDTTNLRGDSALHLVQLINEVNQYMNASGGRGNILVHGYASEEGGTAHNQTLSQNRANYVKGLLAASGVPAGRMIPVGHGEDVSRPTLENNRRVEVTYVPPVTCDPCRLDCNGVPRLLETRPRNYGGGPDWTTAPQPVGGARGLAVNTMDFLKSDIELQNIMNIELSLLAGGLGRAMTAHFRGGSRATVHHNPGTPLEVLTHRSSSAQTYFNTVEAQLATQLHIMKTLGTVDCSLFNITGVPHLHFPITSMGDPAPLRAIIGGTQGHELYITGMRALGNTIPCAYEVDVKLILFDDFGVDTTDLYSPSLMAFWILQHRRRGNRPFINRIETNRSFIL